jgi:hypothetical protein
VRRPKMEEREKKKQFIEPELWKFSKPLDEVTFQSVGSPVDGRGLRNNGDDCWFKIGSLCFKL